MMLVSVLMVKVMVRIGVVTMLSGSNGGGDGTDDGDPGSDHDGSDNNGNVAESSCGDGKDGCGTGGDDGDDDTRLLGVVSVLRELFLVVVTILLLVVVLLAVMVEVEVEITERFGNSGFSSPLPHIWTVLAYCVERMNTANLNTIFKLLNLH